MVCLNGLAGAVCSRIACAQLNQPSTATRACDTLEPDATLAVTIAATTTSTTTLEEGAPQNGEIAAMRKQLALLRAAVKDLQLDHERPIN